MTSPQDPSKNYGPSVSGVLDQVGRNWETIVFQAGKPVLDKELNLQQDIDNGDAENDLLRAMPSGWIADDFTTSSNQTSGVFVSTVVSDTIRMPQNMVAHVNGWLLQIGNTGIINTNQLVLSSCPTGAGVTRTDVVVLEVWRVLLSPSPNTAGKSASGRIWGHGNVKNDPSNDASLNFADDLLDTNLGQESTKRVQIQFRLRVISGVDLFAHPYAMNDSAVVANTVPASAGSPDGSASAFSYTNQGTVGDPGLWVAGDGNPANSLGTVDGYMYAIPLLAVFRRNSTAFNAVTNQNGGQLSPTSSDRPDGLNSDLIVARDIVDLRSGVSPTGWSYSEILEKNLVYLFDNTLTTEWTNTSFGGGQNGATILWSDQIGPTPSDGSGALIANFDATRRQFSDRPIYEILSVAITEPLGGWASSVNAVNFTSLAVFPYAAFNWAAFASSGVLALDVVGAHFIGAYDGNGTKTADVLNHIVSVTGLGANPISTLTLTFDALTGLGITTETLYLDILVAYPGGGLTKTATNNYGNSSFTFTSSPPSSSAPVSYSALANLSIDGTHRETQIQYVTSSVTTAIFRASTDTTGFGSVASVSTAGGGQATITGLTDITSAAVGKNISFSGASSSGNNGTFQVVQILSPSSLIISNGSAVAPDANNGSIVWNLAGTSFRMPERVSSVSNVKRNGTNIAGSVTLSDGGRRASFTNPADYTSPGDTLQITYVALRPMVQTGTSAIKMNVWYEARAPQTGRDAIISTSMTLIPRYISPNVYVITSGSGSEDTGYPFPNAYVQTGGIYNTSSGPTFAGEHQLNARASISVADFNATTGFLKLPSFVPYMPDPELVTFNRATSADVDIEGRTFFKAVPGGQYAPNAFAQNLSDPSKHKVIVPMLAELVDNTSSYGHKGQLLLVLLIRWAPFDATNGIFFESDLTQNTTVASVFRIKGNLLNKRNV